MNSIESLIGLGIVLIGMFLILIFSIQRRGRGGDSKSRRRSAVRSGLRPIPSIRQLQRAMGLAVENGTRLHVSLGSANISGANAASALVGLRTLERVAQISSISDRPPIATSGDGGLSLLSQDTLSASYRIANASELYDPDRGRLAGPTPFSYAAGSLAVIRGENVSANLFVGNFGPEIALMIEAGDQKDAFSMAASDSLSAQSILYATAKAPLIGEELFAIPAYLQAGPVHLASLRTQDVLRWVLVIGLLAGAGLKFLGFV